MNPRAARRPFWVATAFYLLILAEFCYMASPFAAYCYAVYGPGLRALADHPLLARLTGAFLPHIAVRTANPVIDAHNLVGAALAAAGLLGFLVSAGQVYHHKLLHRGAVLGGAYRWVRHPQYTCLTVAGAGFLLLWPRYLVLLSFVTMLFAYRFLARVEERECLARFGPAYREYLDRTRAFLPFGRPNSRAGGGTGERTRGEPGTGTGGEPGARTEGATGYQMEGVPGTGTGDEPGGGVPRPGGRVRRAVRFAVTYAGALALALTLALTANELSLRALSTRATPNAVDVAVTRLDAATLDRVAGLVHGCPEVTAAIAGAGPDARFINYVLPAGWYVSETLMAPRPGGGHLVPAGADGHRYRVVVTRARLSRPADGGAILRYATSRSPVLEVVVDLASARVVEVRPPYRAHPYTGVPVPVY